MNNNLRKIFLKHFKQRYKTFIIIGCNLLKVNSLDSLFKNFCEYTWNEITLYDSINLCYQDPFGKALCKNDASFFEKQSIVRALLISKIRTKFIEDYKYEFTDLLLNSKKYFEAASWFYFYASLNIKYCVILEIAKHLEDSRLDRERILLRTLEEDKELKPFSVLRKIIITSNSIETILNKLLETDIVLDFLKPYGEVKLDYSGSGLIIMSLFVNDLTYMELAGIHHATEETKNSPKGYNIILDQFRESNKAVEDFAEIDKFLALIKAPYMREAVKNIIFDKTLVKNDLMVKGYGGTLFGSEEKIKKQLKNLLENNGYNIYANEYELFKQLSKTSRKIAKELDNLIVKKFTAISEKYIKFINEITKVEEMKQSNIIIPNFITNYALDVKKTKTIMMCLTTIDHKIKKFKRSSRRTISYYTQAINYQKLNKTLGPNIIHGFDAIIVYYTKRILKILNPELRIATIFDAFIFSDHIDIQTFKNICRLALQLSFSHSFMDNLLKINDISSTEFFNQFYANIFDPLKDNALERIIKSDYLEFLFTHKNLWFIDNARLVLNKNIFLESYKHFVSKDKQRFNDFVKTLTNKGITIDKNNLDLYRIQFIITELDLAQRLLQENFGTSSPDKTTVIGQLNKIINNNQFIK